MNSGVSLIILFNCLKTPLEKIPRKTPWENSQGAYICFINM